MTVYIVIETDTEYWQIKGVFAMRDRAVEFMRVGEGMDKNNYTYYIVEEPVEGTS